MSGLLGLVETDLVRTLRLPEYPRLAVHEVVAPAMLRSVTVDRAHPYDYSIETMTGDDRDIRVRVNAAAVLRRELRRRSWRRSTVAVGVTGADPYGVLEERYRLMPGVISALAESNTPFVLFTGSDLVVRDLSLLRVVRHAVSTTVVMTVPCIDDDLSRRADPDGSAPAARLDAVRRLADAGLEPHVRIAPLLPCLTDSSSQLDALLSELAEAGASRVSVSVLQLDPDDGYLDWLATEHPALLRRYRSLYGRGSFVPADYAVRLRERMTPLVREYGLARPDDAAADVSPPAVIDAVESESLTLF
ncbi:radical SAM protein [Gordonia spumicola]|uniref:Radical SAM protein n=1 Tax=Gordonia spumicola TaxID=589161 RepID=A0A7I9V961_9ACTN|nr:sam dependent methyltransferase [Gordonia spumicola]GEE01928.1 radical SAM protein [Gordonia spumicola]